MTHRDVADWRVEAVHYLEGGEDNERNFILCDARLSPERFSWTVTFDEITCPRCERLTTPTETQRLRMAEEIDRKIEALAAKYQSDHIHITLDVEHGPQYQVSLDGGPLATSHDFLTALEESAS